MAEAAAVFVGSLAFPKDITKAECVAGVLICSAIDMMVSKPEKWGDPPEDLRLVCRLRDRSAGESLLRDATRIISAERLAAAKMAWPKLHAAVYDAANLSRPAEVPGPTSAAMIAAVGAGLSQPGRQRSTRGRKAIGGDAEGNKGNIFRSWRNSLPVLHMAVALDVEIREAGLSALNIGDLIADPGLTRRLIERATTIAPWTAHLFAVKDQISIVPFGLQLN